MAARRPPTTAAAAATRLPPRRGPPEELAVDARMPGTMQKPPHQLLHDPHGIAIAGWRLTARKSHILKAADADRCAGQCCCERRKHAP